MGKRDTYSWQRISVNDAALIESIIHDDIQEEAFAVRAFMA